MLWFSAMVVTLFTAADCAVIGSDDVNVVRMTHSDQGGLTNCGPKESRALLQWSPAVLKMGTFVLVDAAATLIEEFSKGTACGTVWHQGASDPIHKCKNFKCEDVQELLKKYLPGLECPAPQGYGFSLSKVRVLVTPLLPLPMGKTHVNITLANQSGKLLFCLSGDIEIQNI